MLAMLPGMDIGPQSEDCLSLNVFTPGCDGARRPVLVWIHGGAFILGAGSQVIYDGIPLASRGDVVVVTINYRLGALGFLRLDDLAPGLGASGNAGLQDQIAALEWVQGEIAAFGGDPANVTIFGESAGGMSVGTLLGTPRARGLFRRAIPQSGAAHNVHTREAATRAAEAFLAECGLSPAGCAALRELPAQQILDAQLRVMAKQMGRGGLLPFQPLVDGDVLPQPPARAIEDGLSAEVSVLVGTTRDEWKLFGFMDPGIATLGEPDLVARMRERLSGSDPEAAARLVETYRKAREGRASTQPRDLFVAIETDRIFRLPAIRLAEAQARRQPQTFAYRFDWESPAMGGMLGACHAIELPFVFGTHGRPGLEMFIGKGPEVDALATRTMDAWLAFARSGDPSHAGVPEWPAYDADRRATLIFGRETRLELSPCDAERQAWDGLF
jgi:para-nitrobenzyl esterase